MVPKSDKEKKPAGKHNPSTGKDSSKKTVSKSKKEMEDDEEDDEILGDADGEETPVGKKTGKVAASKKSADFKWVSRWSLLVSIESISAVNTMFDAVDKSSDPVSTSRSNFLK